MLRSLLTVAVAAVVLLSSACGKSRAKTEVAADGWSVEVKRGETTTKIEFEKEIF